ncbi:hypothetical protein SB861_00565 [Paraburkholderia sp. SIMBA_049]
MTGIDVFYRDGSALIDAGRNVKGCFDLFSFEAAFLLVHRGFGTLEFCPAQTLLGLLVVALASA